MAAVVIGIPRPPNFPRKLDWSSSLAAVYVGFSLALAGCSAGDAPKPADPNFLFILTDDQGWSQLSKSTLPELQDGQSDYLETPNMDRLSDTGMRFTNGYAPASVCTPTRRAILCGTTTARSGSEFKSSWNSAEQMTIPRALRLANPDYQCAHYGKWGERMVSTPEECGYDASDGMTGNTDGGWPSSLNPDVDGATHGNTPPYYTDQEDPKLSRLHSSVGRHALGSRLGCRQATERIG